MTCSGSEKRSLDKKAPAAGRRKAAGAERRNRQGGGEVGLQRFRAWEEERP